MSRTKQPLEDRFWSKVDIHKDTDECWEWQGGKSNGYGMFGIGSGNVKRAHQVAYLLTYGIPAVNNDILHSCGNKLCCNPLHLEEGKVENKLRDILSLSPRIKYQVRCMQGTYNNRYIAAKLGISTKSVYNIITGKR